MNDDEIRLLISEANDELDRARNALSVHNFEDAYDSINDASKMVKGLLEDEQSNDE